VLKTPREICGLWSINCIYGKCIFSRLKTRQETYDNAVIVTLLSCYCQHNKSYPFSMHRHIFQAIINNFKLLIA